VKSKISVLHVIASLDLAAGGPSCCVPDQCWATAMAGFEMGVSFVWSGGKLSPEADLLNLRKVKAFPVKSLLHSQALWGHVSNYDIIHVDGVWSPYCHLGIWFARLQKKPVVITPHGMLEPWALGVKKVKKLVGYKLFLRRDLDKAAVLQATALEEAGHLRALGVRTPIAVIPNGVSIPNHKGKVKKPILKRRRLLFLSRVHPKKGVLELIRAVASLREIFDKEKWLLTIAGPDEGGHWTVVKKEAQKLGVENLVEYLGPVEGNVKWNLYRSSSLFILPTYSENFGLVIAEALGCGVPVITTQGAPWKDLNIHRCGWWYPIGQKELVATLRRAMTTPSQVLQSMGERGKKLVDQNYSWPSIGHKLKETYEWILKKEAKPHFVMD
jgi:glycosyltransferase involved in cell wall biosynthesis